MVIPVNRDAGARAEADAAARARYPHLFADIRVGGRRLRNRITHASITTRLSHERRVTAGLIGYYANRAKGGAALIVSEPLSAARIQNLPHKVRVWNDDDRDGLKRWAEAVESYDTRLLGQLQDAGRGRHERGRNPDAIGISPAPDDLSWTVPRVLARWEIERMMSDFAESSVRLQACGFSGVELSACHGHLFHQFLSPLMNGRRDEFGGDIEGRLSFMRRLLSAVRESCGAAFLIGLKMPADDGMPGGIDPCEAAKLAARLARSGYVDYFCFAQGSHSRALDMHIPDMNWPRVPFAGLIKTMRAAVTGIPVVALGLITDPNEAEALLANGTADLVGLGRALIADPAWGLKAGAGREADIRYCVSCNSCWATITEHRSVACDNNPRVARADEVDWWPIKSHTVRSVVVIGAGIAGMEAAWVAAARGHRVTVFGASADGGGKLRLLAALPGGESLSSIYDYQALCAKKAGVQLRLNETATVDAVLALSPDVIINAAGSSMSWPAGLPDEWRDAGVFKDLRHCMRELLQFTQPQGGAAVIYDLDATEGTYASAERLQPLFDRVIVLTPRDRIAEDVPLVTRLGILRRFARKRIETWTLMEPAEQSRWQDGVLVCRNVYNGDLREVGDVALFTYSSPRIAETQLAEVLRPHVAHSYAVGDAFVPRGTMAATSQGHQIGCLV